MNCRKTSLAVCAVGVLGLSGLVLASERKPSPAAPLLVASYTSDGTDSQTLKPSVKSEVSTKGGEGPSVSSPLDQIYFNLFSTFHGSPLHDLGSEYSVDRTGKEKKSNYNAINFDSEVTAAYRITKDIGIGPVVPFLAVPARAQGFILGDVGIKAYNAKTLDRHGLRVYTNLIVQAPTSESSSAREMTWALKTTPALRYSIPHSNFAVGTWTEAKDYFGVSKDKTFKLFAAPYVNYALSDAFSLNLGYAMEWHHNVGQKGFGFDAYQTDLEPGFIVKLAKGVSVNPYVQFFTTNKMDMDHAAVGAVISATVL